MPGTGTGRFFTIQTMTAIVLLLIMFAAAACAPLGLLAPLEGTAIPSPPPPTLAQFSAEPEPTGTPTKAGELDPAFLVYHEGRVRMIDSNGAALSSWDAPGLDPASTDWFQVVGDALYYLNEADGKIYLNRQGSTLSLEFTGEAPVHAFALSDDETRIAWSIRAQGSNELWISSSNGLGRTLVVDTPPHGASSGELTLVPVMWTQSGALVYSWSYLGMGDGETEAFGSLYEYEPTSNLTSILAELPDSPAPPCWKALTVDAEYLAGVCGSSGGSEQLRIVEAASDLEELVLVVDGQSEVGAAAFSAGRRVAYAVQDRALPAGTTKVAMRSYPGDEPIVLIALDGQPVNGIEWLDEGRIILEVGGLEQPAVYLLTVHGQDRFLADGWLLGWVNTAAED